MNGECICRHLGEAVARLAPMRARWNWKDWDVVNYLLSTLQRHGEVDSTPDCTRLHIALRVVLCGQRILARCTAPHPDPR